ncbi:ECF transporter S component [Hathewaya limosa]|uniref:Energy-coupling factor transport system substrate-specific component n=1 Tax=Hathewaya limosa TaxID=1536 RepID=A0ABU0JWJ4_HATLI|nr:ECF transporter S component [Hathewaya limosa]MDQ0480835.1 energy-coupling factor transport system substrate-specific component [Hathewaya limosa]
MQNSKIGKRLKISTIFILVIFPLLLLLYSLYDNRNYALISIIFIVLSMLPFFMLFEMKKPRAREWVPLAVMAAIAAIGRIVFAPIPSFKPTTAIIIITSVVFGPESGFLTGTITAIASNLFFGQGPWTPWQMFAWGTIGFLAGVLSKFKILNKRWKLCVYGMVSGFLFGWIMNIWAATGFINEISWKMFAMLYVSSFWFDFTHGIATVVFLYLLSESWIAKLERIKMKFGLIER